MPPIILGKKDPSLNAKSKYLNTGNNMGVPAFNSSTSANMVKSSITANPAATNPVKLPPAGQQFVNSLANTPAYNAQSGLLTDFGRSQGLQEVNVPQTTTTTSNGSLGTANTSRTTNTATTGTSAYDTARTGYLDAYKKYLDSLSAPKETSVAEQNIEALNKRTASELLRTRQREDELRANKIGQLQRGQQYQLGEEERLSNRSLADLAIAKGVSLDTIKLAEERRKQQQEALRTGAEFAKSEVDFARGEKPVEVGGNLVDPRTGEVIYSVPEKAEPFTLGEGQVRYDAEGKPIATGAPKKRETTVTEVGNRKVLVDTQTGEVIKDIGPRSMSEAEITKAVEKNDAKTAAKSDAINAVGIIDDLLANSSLSKISGYADQILAGLYPGKSQTAINQFNQVKGILALENRQKLKGSGAVSDFESRTLERAASSLGRNLSDTEFKEQLRKVRGAFATAAGLTVSVRITDPRTNESQMIETDRAGIDSAISDGLLVEY